MKIKALLSFRIVAPAHTTNPIGHCTFCVAASPLECSFSSVPGVLLMWRSALPTRTRARVANPPPGGAEGAPPRPRSEGRTCAQLRGGRVEASCTPPPDPGSDGEQARFRIFDTSGTLRQISCRVKYRKSRTSSLFCTSHEFWATAKRPQSPLKSP